MKYATRTVRFADSPLRWVSGLPMWQTGTHYGGLVFDFLARLPEIKECLARQIDDGVYYPPVLSEHTPAGLAAGAAVAWRVYTRSEALALGVTQQADAELYLGLDLRDPAIAAAYDAGTLRYTSPEIRGSIVDPQGLPWKDDVGHPWVFFLGEISAVSVPHNKRQTAATSLIGVQMAGRKMMDEGLAPEAAAEAAGELEELEVPTLEGLAAKVDTLIADIQAIKAAVMAIAPAAAPAMAEPELMPPPAAIPVTPTMADHRSSILALTAVRAAMRDRNFGDRTEAALVAVAMRDPASFALMADLAPARPRPANRQAQAGSVSVALFGSREHASAMIAKATGPDGVFNGKRYVTEWRKERAQVVFTSTAPKVTA